MDTSRALPGSWYGDPQLHERLIERVFSRSWQAGPARADLAEAGDAVPWRLGPGTLDEPVVTLRTPEGGLRTLSNACTHRGAQLVAAPCRLTRLRCPYHGRRFDLRGQLEAAPGFPALPPGEDLPELPTEALGPLVFSALDAPAALRAAIGEAWARLWPALERPMVPTTPREVVWDIEVSWALYVDNYLEGLHIAFVHPELARCVDPRAYAVEVLPGGVLQTAEATDGVAFDLPPGHPDHGRAIAAYYLWLFPNLMLNLYPWGLSLNHVQPRGPRAVRVVYRTWVADPSMLGRGAGGALDLVERQDQEIIRRVQAAVGARRYRPGRYAPGQEDGVRAFHGWLRAALDP